MNFGVLCATALWLQTVLIGGGSPDPADTESDASASQQGESIYETEWAFNFTTPTAFETDGKKKKKKKKKSIVSFFFNFCFFSGSLRFFFFPLLLFTGIAVCITLNEPKTDLRLANMTMQ